MNISDNQWEVIFPLLPSPKSGEGNKGRPAKDQREVLNGILWICRTGAQWNELPSKYPPYQTCHRYFQKWVKAGVWEKVLWALARDLKDRGKIDITECFIDGTFASAKKGGFAIGKTKKGKGTKIMAIADASGLPLSVWTTGASTHEVKLVEQTIEHRFIKEKPKRIIGDLAYDSDPLDEKLKKKKIKLIAPHKRNRKKMRTQDGRELRRYCKRWRVERLFAWIQNFRRCVVRYEYKPENYLDFVQLACV
ncbi:MAG: IS5 family transposase, partial [Microcystis panniformis]